MQGGDRCPEWEACLSYFGSKKVYQRIFSGLQKKYQSLGHVGGSVALAGLTGEEKEQLGGFLGKNYLGNKTVTVSAAAFQRALDDSRFSGIQLKDLLEAMVRGPLVGKREEREERRRAREEFFQRILERSRYGAPVGREGRVTGSQWLEGVLAGRKSGCHLLMQLYGENPKALERTLGQVLKAASSLPVYMGEQERLPVFAARITGNPHSFDEQTNNFRLLSAYIIETFHMERGEALSGPEWNSQVLYQAGILKDDLSNMVLAYGIRGVTREGKSHAGMEGYLAEREPAQLTLQTIGRLAKACPAHPRAGTESIIYVVENPAVFSVLCKARPDGCIVCGGGQPRLAALLLLDLLARWGILYYAGDFDPEGLVIAQNLKRRYGSRLKFWGYRAEDYESCCSDTELSKKSLKKLERVTEEGLQEVKEAMAARGRAAYQESMLEALLAF